jgi:membrane dipeptidase
MTSTPKIPVIDLLGGTIATLTPPASNPMDYGGKLAKAGVVATSLTMALYARDIRPVLKEFFDFQNVFREAAATVRHVRTAADVEASMADGKIGVIQSVQGLHFIEDETAYIQILATLGLRVAALTYNEQTQFGAGCMELTDGGLTLLGRRTIQEMNRCGILVDLSHAGRRTSLDIIANCTKPVAATHSNADGLTPSVRNITDEQIKAIASTGGVVGISPYSPFCVTAKGGRPALADVIAHMRYVADLVGVAHVALGTDFFPHSKIKWENGTRRMYPEMAGKFVFETLYAEGFADYADLPAFPGALRDAGFAPVEIAAICHGNALRVMKANWGA